MNQTRDEEIEETREDDKAFAAFLEMPMTQLALSMVTPAENPDVMKMLLKAAFSAGKARGGGAIAKFMMKSMIEDMRKNHERPR